MAEGKEEEKKKDVGGDENPRPYPPGFRFTPTDDELIEYYLLPRLQGRPHVPNAAIINDYVYSCHPDDLLLNGKYKDKGQDDTWYFLSSRARKYTNGSRPSRSTDDGRGRWKASTGCVSAVTAGNTVYCQRGLGYYDGPSYKEEDKGKWLMRELTVPQYENKLGDDGDMCKIKTLDEFVMCKIYMTTRGKNKEKVHEAGPSGKLEETCPPASQPGPVVETGQETAKPMISKRQKGKRPVEEATPKQSPPAPPRPQPGPTQEQSLYGGGMPARFETTTGYHHHYGAPGRPMAYNPHTSIPPPPLPVAFPGQVPGYRAAPVASPTFLGQALMMPHLGPASEAFRPPRPMTVPSVPAGQASRPPRPMTVPSCPAGQAVRPPRPTTVPSYPAMQRQPETEEMRKMRVYNQHLNEFLMMRHMMQQQQQQQQPGNAAYAAQQQPRLMAFMQQQQQQPYFGAGFNHQYARPPMAPQFLPSNYHQTVEAGQQVQCGYPVPDSGAAPAMTTPAGAEAGSIGAKNEGADVRGDCNNDEEKGSGGGSEGRAAPADGDDTKHDSPH